MALLRWRGVVLVVVLVALLALVLPASAGLEEVDDHGEHHDEHFDPHNEAHHEEGHGEEHHEEHQEDGHHAEEPQEHQFEEEHVEVDHGEHEDHANHDGEQEHHQEHEEEHHFEEHHVEEHHEDEHAGEHDGEDHSDIHSEGHLQEPGDEVHHEGEDPGHGGKRGEAEHPLHAEGGGEHEMEEHESVNPDLDRMTGEEHHEDPWLEKRAHHDEDVHQEGDLIGHHQEVNEEEIDMAGGQGEGFDFTQEDHDQPIPDEIGHEGEAQGHYEPEEVPMEDSDAIPDDSNCEAGPWGHWGKCSLHCGGGTQLRTREYTDPATMTGSCDWIELVQERGCNDQPCTEEDLAEQDREEAAEVIDNSTSMFEGDLTVAYLGVAAVILVGGVFGIMRGKKRREKDPILLR